MESRLFEWQPLHGWGGIMKVGRYNEPDLHVSRRNDGVWLCYANQHPDIATYEAASQEEAIKLCEAKFLPAQQPKQLTLF